MANFGEPILALVDRWIIDYFSRLMWHHFEEHGTVAGDWVDGYIQERCAQDLETQPGENLDVLEALSRLLIQFMCRISSGADCTKIIDDRTELEEAIEILDQIVVIGKHGLSAPELLKIQISVKQQAVYACCRDGNFDLAAKVFFRQWKSWKTIEEMEARKNIAEVLDSKNHVHALLNSMPYETTVNNCKNILRRIFSNMAPPFLINAAKNVWERMNRESAVEDDEAGFSIQNNELFPQDKFLKVPKSVDITSETLQNEVIGGANTDYGMQILQNSPNSMPCGQSDGLTVFSSEQMQQSYPLFLWTDSAQVLPTGVASSSVNTYPSTSSISQDFLHLGAKTDTVSVKQELFTGLNSIQNTNWLNTVPVVSSPVYVPPPLGHETLTLGSRSIGEIWSNAPSSDHCASAGQTTPQREPVATRKPRLYRRRGYKRRGAARNNLNRLSQVEFSPVMTEILSPPDPAILRKPKPFRMRGRKRHYIDRMDAKVISDLASPTDEFSQEDPVTTQPEHAASPKFRGRRGRMRHRGRGSRTRVGSGVASRRGSSLPTHSAEQSFGEPSQRARRGGKKFRGVARTPVKETLNKPNDVDINTKPSRINSPVSASTATGALMKRKWKRRKKQEMLAGTDKIPVVCLKKISDLNLQKVGSKSLASKTWHSPTSVMRGVPKTAADGLADTRSLQVKKPYESSWFQDPTSSNDEDLLQSSDNLSTPDTSLPSKNSATPVTKAGRSSAGRSSLSYSRKRKPCNWWTSSDLKVLEEGVRKYGRRWAIICNKYFPSRKPADLCSKWSRMNMEAEESN